MKVKQVWNIDSDGYLINSTTDVENPTEFQITKPYLGGCIKPRWNGDDWVEGATQEEIEEFNKENKIDICHEKKPKSLEEQVRDLQKEKEQLWETVQFLLKKTGMIGDEKDATD